MEVWDRAINRARIEPLLKGGGTSNDAKHKAAELNHSCWSEEAKRLQMVNPHLKGREIAKRIKKNLKLDLSVETIRKKIL